MKKKKVSYKPQASRGYWGQQDSEPPAPLSNPGKLTWFSNFAPFGIQFRYWFFIIVIIIAFGIFLLYKSNPYKSDLNKSIALLNEAVALSDPGGTGDYLSYWNDDILTKMKDGISLSESGVKFFTRDSYSDSIMQTYFLKFSSYLEYAYNQHLLGKEIQDSVTVKIFSDMGFVQDLTVSKADIYIWMNYWKAHEQSIKEQLGFW